MVYYYPLNIGIMDFCFSLLIFEKSPFSIMIMYFSYVINLLIAFRNLEQLYAFGTFPLSFIVFGKLRKMLFLGHF